MDTIHIEKELKKLFLRYKEILEGEDPSCYGSVPEGTDIPQLIKMIDFMLNNLSTMDMGKLDRWLGYIQGVMTTMSLLTVKEERELTRPIFNPDGSLPIVDVKGENNGK